jgi:hypothetical protein
VLWWRHILNPEIARICNHRTADLAGMAKELADDRARAVADGDVVDADTIGARSLFGRGDETFAKICRT